MPLEAILFDLDGTLPMLQSDFVHTLAQLATDMMLIPSLLT